MLSLYHCENIPTWISLCLTTVFSQQGGISVLNSPRGFWRSLGQISHFIGFIDSFIDNHLKT
jgi:hypothetical protein